MENKNEILDLIKRYGEIVRDWQNKCEEALTQSHKNLIRAMDAEVKAWILENKCQMLERLLEAQKKG